MLSTILGDGKSSRLYCELIEKPQNPYYYQVESCHYQFRDGDNLFIEANFDADKKDIVVLIISLLIGFFIMTAYSNETYIIYTFIYLIVIFTLIILSKNKNKKFKILFFIAIFSELGINGYLSIYTASELPYGKVNNYDELLELANKNDFDDNYRVIYNYSYTDRTNDTLLLNKNSSTRYFSSVINGNVLNFFDRI